MNHITICSTSLQNQKSCGVIRCENVLDCFGLVKLAEAEDVCRSSLGQVSFFNLSKETCKTLQVALDKFTSDGNMLTDCSAHSFT